MDSAEDNIPATEPVERWLSGISRRTFLRRGTISAAAVGVMTAMPTLPGLLAGGASEAPAVETEVTQSEGEAAALTEPLVAHVKDLATGEISLFQGEREILIRNPSLARQILSATRP